MAAVALVGAAGGALCASAVAAQRVRPLVLVLLVGGGHLDRRPAADGPGASGCASPATATTWWPRPPVAAIGFYDGIFGPGTGAFLVVALVGLLGYAFLPASATARIVNLATNIGALLVFIPQGAPMWRLGLAMGACNVAGGWLGAHTAIRRGSGFVRVGLPHRRRRADPAARLRRAAASDTSPAGEFPPNPGRTRRAGRTARS